MKTCVFLKETGSRNFLFPQSNQLYNLTLINSQYDSIAKEILKEPTSQTIILYASVQNLHLEMQICVF